MANMDEVTNVDSTKDVCNVCHDDIEIYAVGRCDHYVCHKCSTRMRVLCEQMYCAICRTDLPEVLFMEKYQKYEEKAGQFKLFHKKENVYFENTKCQDAFFDLLSHKCKKCSTLHPLKTFRELELHMRKEHNLHYCDICVKDLKIFTAERKCYTRELLARHRRLGDADDKSFKGHPLCELCDQRYLDRDELARHCRKEHYYCHFCESDGLPLVFFGDYSLLKDHFKEEHYLCEEGDCVQAQFTNAFRSEIDLKAHRAGEHSKSMNKAEIRQARTIEVDLHFAPRHSLNRSRGVRNRSHNQEFGNIRGGSTRHDEGDDHQNSKEQHQYHAKRQREEQEVAQAVALHLNQIHRQSGAVAMVDRALLNPVSHEQMSQEPASENKQAFLQMKEDFPVLNGGKDETTSLDMNKRNQVGQKDLMAKKVAMAANLSVKEDDMENGDYPSLSGHSGGKRQQPTLYSGAWQTQPGGSDFPALSSKKPTSKNHNQVGPTHGMQTKSWLQTASNVSSTKSEKPRKKLDRPDAVPTEDDFPSLQSIGNLLLNLKPAAQVSSQTKFSSAAGAVSSSFTGMGHGQPIKSSQSVKPSSINNFTKEDFPALGNKTESLYLPKQQQWAKPARKSRKEPAPMPDFTGSSDTNPKSVNSNSKLETRSSDKEETHKTQDDGDDWVEVKSKANGEEKQWKDVAGTTGQQSKSKKKAKKGNKKKSPENSDITERKSTSENNARSESKEQNCDNTSSDRKVSNKSEPADTSKKGDGKRKQKKNACEKKFKEDQSKANLLKNGSGPEYCKASNNNKQSDVSEHRSDQNENRVKQKMASDRNTSSTGSNASSNTGSLLKQSGFGNGGNSSVIDSFPSLLELSENASTIPSLSIDNFPSLVSGKQAPDVPPGFNDMKGKSGSGPPPGFTRSATNPPPGFRKPLVSKTDKVVPVVGGSPLSPNYIEPANFKARNEKLVNDIRKMLSAEEFNKFKTSSGEFRRSLISAKEYYNTCCSIMGCDHFNEILPELISLLPDIEKQQELFTMHLANEVKSGDVIEIKDKKMAWKSNASVLSLCTICRQVVNCNELSEHVTNHDTFSDFPTLTSISASLRTTWPKK